MSWTQNVALPNAWGGKVILLECMRFLMQVVESDEGASLLFVLVHTI